MRVCFFACASVSVFEGAWSFVGIIILKGGVSQIAGMGSCTLQEWAVGVLYGALSSCLSWIESLRVVPRDVRMLPCSYVCVCVYIYVAYRYVNTYDIWIYIYTYEYICTLINMHKYLGIHTCTDVNTSAVAQTHLHSAKAQRAALPLYMYSACSRHICMTKVTNESYHSDLWVILHLRMSRAQRHVRVTHVWVMTPISWHTPMSHVTHQWVMSHTNKSCHARINASCYTDHWVTYSAMYAIVITASLCMSDATPMNKSRHTHEWAMSHLYTSHVHTRMSHVTLINESCHTYQRVMPHIWTSHVTRINACVMSDIWKMFSWASTNTSQSVCCKGVYAIACTRTPLLRTSCLYQTPPSFKGVLLVSACPCPRLIKCTCVTWLVHMCDMT